MVYIVHITSTGIYTYSIYMVHISYIYMVYHLLSYRVVYSLACAIMDTMCGIYKK